MMKRRRKPVDETPDAEEPKAKTLTEQVEEEANPTEMVQKLDIVGKDGNGILTIDSQLATRVFVPPQSQG